MSGSAPPGGCLTTRPAASLSGQPPSRTRRRQFLRISGVPLEERADNLVKLGRLLWVKRLSPALRALEGDPATAHRARLLLAMTSYDGGRDLAEGISAAGVSADKIVLAVRPGTTAGPGHPVD